MHNIALARWNINGTTVLRVWDKCIQRQTKNKTDGIYTHRVPKKVPPLKVTQSYQQ